MGDIAISYRQNPDFGTAGDCVIFPIRPFHLIRLACIAMALAVMAVPPIVPASAATQVAQDDLLGQLLSVEDRLNLSAKQKDEIRPILNRSVHRRIVILREFGLQGDVAAAKYLTPRQKWSIIQQLHEVNVDTEHKLSEYLYPSQMEVYRKAEDQFRDEVEQRIADRMAQ